LRWLEKKTPVIEDAVQEVNVVAKEVKPDTLHPICLVSHLNLELAMTSRVTCSPLAQEIRTKIERCFAHLRKRWQGILEPSTVTGPRME
jgi:hypothetical protein